MKRILPILACSIVMLGTGLLHGFITNRWGPSIGLQQAIDRLDRLPLVADDWDGTVLQRDVEPQTVRKSGAFVLAHFVNRRTGDAVQVSLICGRPGTLSLHPPTICFPAHGYQEKARPSRVEVPLKESGNRTEWMAADFGRAIAAGEERIHVLWCYGFQGQWTTPDNPRIALAGQGAVYKLYVARVGDGEGARGQKDPSVAFLGVFLPELEKALFGT
jgi:hypothetical protein